MSLNIAQYPASASLAQSPMVFSIYENTDAVLSQSFQYYADLYYWTGSQNQSGSVPQYTLVKYPNESLYGMFDVSRIMNSTLSDTAFANTSNIKYYAVDFYWQYPNASNQLISGSHVKTGVYKALDGYALFQEPINQQIVSKSVHWPIMSDGPVSQSFLEDTAGWMTVYVGNVGVPQPTRMVYSGSLGNASFNVAGTISSSQQTNYFPISTGCDDWPLSLLTDSFSVQAYSGSVALGSPINFQKACLQKYPNIRIKWKNRYGQFDYYNFYLVNRQGFSSTKRTYQPQLGSWQGTTLTYQDYDSSVLNYISDSTQTLSVNSDYLPEAYNEILKQLMVSDEIYWIYDYTADAENVRPITIRTDSITFKTGVNDKLIQYSFDFNWGQSYKLIL
jgi:hypothetical protein